MLATKGECSWARKTVSGRAGDGEYGPSGASVGHHAAANGGENMNEGWGFELLEGMVRGVDPRVSYTGVAGGADALGQDTAQAIHGPARDDLVDEDAGEHESHDGQTRVSFHVFPLVDDGDRRGGNGSSLCDLDGGGDSTTVRVLISSPGRDGRHRFGVVAGFDGVRDIAGSKDAAQGS